MLQISVTPTWTLPIENLLLYSLASDDICANSHSGANRVINCDNVAFDTVPRSTKGHDLLSSWGTYSLWHLSGNEIVRLEILIFTPYYGLLFVLWFVALSSRNDESGSSHAGKFMRRQLGVSCHYSNEVDTFFPIFSSSMENSLA